MSGSGIKLPSRRVREYCWIFSWLPCLCSKLPLLWIGRGLPLLSCLGPTYNTKHRAKLGTVTMNATCLVSTVILSFSTTILIVLVLVIVVVVVGTIFLIDASLLAVGSPSSCVSCIRHRIMASRLSKRSCSSAKEMG